MQKAVLIALAIIGTLTAGYLLIRSPSQKVGSTLFNQWKNQHNISFSAAEEEYRFKIFSENQKLVEAHNALPTKTFTVALNAFAHLTQAEFAATYLGFKGFKTPKSTVSIPFKDTTTSVDWTSKMNAVKNQGQCGSCWAFSAVGGIEGAHSVLKGNLYQLSEQELVDCSQSFGNEGCNGGLMDDAFQYVVSVGGLATEDEYPYTGSDGTCNKDVKTRQGKISNFTDVTANSTDAFRGALAVQPLSVAIEADQWVFQLYFGGVIGASSCGLELDHGVVAVGFDFKPANGDSPYYKVRNSWGSWWGESGYFRLAIQDGANPGTCGIQMSASFPTL